MNELAATQGPGSLDDLWRPAHWRDRIGGSPLDGFLVGALVLAIGWNLVANLWLPGAWWVIANLTLAALLLAAARRAGLSFEELGLRPDRIGRGLAVGAAAAGIVAAGLAIAVVVPAFRGWFDDPAIARHDASTDVYMALVRIPLGTVVLEELFFRGVLLALALRRWEVRTAVLVTAGLFGLWHIVPAAESGSALEVLGTVAITTAAGGLFAWLRLRANSLAAPAVAHIATNSFAYVAAVIAVELT